MLQATTRELPWTPHKDPLHRPCASQVISNSFFDTTWVSLFRTPATQGRNI